MSVFTNKWNDLNVIFQHFNLKFRLTYIANFSQLIIVIDI